MLGLELFGEHAMRGTGSSGALASGLELKAALDLCRTRALEFDKELITLACVENRSRPSLGLCKYARCALGFFSSLAFPAGHFGECLPCALGLGLTRLGSNGESVALLGDLGDTCVCGAQLGEGLFGRELRARGPLTQLGELGRRLFNLCGKRFSAL